MLRHHYQNTINTTNNTITTTTTITITTIITITTTLIITTHHHYHYHNHHHYQHHHHYYYYYYHYNSNSNNNSNCQPSQWFDNDLTPFSEFVSSKTLLSHVEEKQLGKAIKIALQLEKMIISINKNNKTFEHNNNITNTINYNNINDSINDNNYFERILTVDERITKLIASQLECSPDTIVMIAITADNAYEKLVSSNLRLVLAVVRRYTKTKVPLAELIAEGTRGLSKAVRRYDFERGFRFATYATWYVTQAVADAARFSTTPAKIPSKYITLRRSLKKFIPQYQEENSRNPTLQEICEALGTCELDVVKCLNIQNAAISLNEVIGKSGGDSKGDRTFEEILQSESGLNPDLQSRQNQLNRDINVALEKNLEKEEKDILKMRLGLGNARAYTISEVSEKYDISWQKVKSLEKQAISKLLNSSDLISAESS